MVDYKDQHRALCRQHILDFMLEVSPDWEWIGWDWIDSDARVHRNNVDEVLDKLVVDEILLIRGGGGERVIEYSLAPQYQFPRWGGRLQRIGDGKRVEAPRRAADPKSPKRVAASKSERESTSTPDQVKVLREMLYDRMKAKLTYYEEKGFEVKSKRRYTPAHDPERRIGYAFHVICRHCDTAYKMDYQIDLEGIGKERTWFELNNRQALHKRNCPKSKWEQILVPHVFGCQCGYPLGTYSPKCSKFESHTPALPDERGEADILEYKRNRLLYMERYLVEQSSTKEGRLLWANFLDDLRIEYEKGLAVSHTYMFTLPARISEVPRARVRSDDSYVRCSLCNELVSGERYSNHREYHKAGRRGRLWKVLAGEIEVV